MSDVPSSARERRSRRLAAIVSRVCQRTTVRSMFLIYLTVIVIGIAGFTLVGLLER
jgi:hypothetical protein